MPVSRPILVRFLEKIEPQTSGCWLWRGGDSKGYPTIGGRNASGKHTMIYAHRLSYEHFIGPIPKKLHIDHLCRTPMCVNPMHLEPVTSRENFLRGEHPLARTHRLKVCVRGHSRVDNVYTPPGHEPGTGYCRTCRREAEIRRMHRISHAREARKRKKQEEESSVST